MRAQARRLGLSIRTRRGSVAAGVPTYTIVESDGRRVVVSDVIGSADLEHRLWLIARDRRLSIEHQPSRSCPHCGATRVANFRWCQSCGTDFEPWRAEPAPMPHVAPTPMPAASSAPEGASTLANPTATMTRPAPVTTTPPPRSATAAGVAVFVLDPAMAATVNAAAAPWPADDPRRTARPIASDPMPPVPRSVVSPPHQRGVRGRIADVLDASPFDGRMILLGVAVGLSIGVLVTLVILAIE